MFWKKTMLLLLAILLLCGAGNAGIGYAADEISRLVLSKNEVTLELGDSAALTATAVYVSGKTEEVTITTDWTSQSPDIAAAYAGRITAKAVGSTTVTATYMGKSVLVAVNVTKKVKALTLDKQTLNVLIGEEPPAQLKLTALYSDGDPEDVTKKADWSIDNPSIATVINGEVKGLNSGTGIITAKFGSQSTTIPVNVEIAHRLEPSKTQVSLLLGGSEPLTLKAIYPDGSEVEDVADKAEWSSDNPAVADALKGKITAYGAGTATITAKYGTKTATIAVDVDTTQKLEASVQNIFLHVGETSEEIKLTATYANGDGTGVSVGDKAQWTSSKESVAYYSNGKIHAVQSGEAVITAKYGNKSVSIQVDVEVPRSLDIVPSYLTMNSGTTKEVIVHAFFAGAKASENITGKVTWSSDNEDIVFAKDGIISAYKAGSATITAKYGEKTATLVVDVDVPQSLTADVTSVAIPVGGAKQITITASYPDGKSDNVTQKVTWASSAPTVASVRQGLITGVATGAASVTATFGNRTVTIPVSVGVLQTLNVDKKKLVMSSGKSETVNVTASYADGTSKNVNEQAAWTSSSAAVAEVYQGKITATGSGKATITATFDGKSVTIAVEVDQATTLSVDPRLLILTVNESAEIKLTATDSAGNTSNVTTDAEWVSSAIKIADVANGRVTGLTNGRATITAKYGGKSITIPVEVGIVTKLEADKRYASIKSNSTSQVTLTATFADGRTMNVTSLADWKTSNYKVADVEKGQITGRAYGKATITAKYNDKIISIPVDVDTLKYLKTDVVQIVMAKGETKQVTATATYMDGSEQNVTKPALWTTSRLLVADVKDGVIKATGSGKATIYVTYGGKKTPIVVTVR
ncbi:Ig-like domain-containing protein [Brevibacillus choshinensis]|uniref:Ig-like domain-containing protein n=1 Tax=Brevibacillus choshinensis TaxID=54911 RepID=A0ABX7FSA7_BRECH|nr:Ig-like domain-containing protein [Brevibacillus choshinensis]QRG68981.1 Ig-like domain-containing protein [Brevibacillus choshinensis]